MKKSLILLPLAAALLSGCLPGGGKKDKSSGNVGPSTDDSPVDLGPTEYNGYRRVMTAPENDKEYIYGIYQVNTQHNIFLNGHHHEDEKGKYPWYMTTTQDVTKAVKIKCHYKDDKYFSIQITGGGEYQTYDGKYLELYSGKKTDGKTDITSLRCVDSAVEKWYFLETYEKDGLTTSVKTNVMDVENPGYNPQPCSMSTYSDNKADYETFSACTPNHFADNFIAHLWEKI